MTGPDLLTACHELGVDADDLAVEADVAVRTVSDWMRERTAPTTITRGKVESALSRLREERRLRSARRTTPADQLRLEVIRLQRALNIERRRTRAMADKVRAALGLAEGVWP